MSDYPESDASPMRIIVVYRADLPEITRAKGEVQFGHAVAAVLHRTSEEQFDAYMASGQIKISMEVADDSALYKIRDRAIARGVTQAMIVDAAHTIFAAPTLTCIGLGPMSKTDGNAVARGAKMRA